MFEDRGGLRLSTTSERAAEDYRRGVDAFLSASASGRRDRDKLLRDLLDGVASAYEDDWWFLGMHGFACTESGSPAEGRRKIERSLALRPRNANAAHALAHVFYEEGDSLGGADFVNGWIPGYERTAQLHCHLSWHLSLFELGAGRGARALAVYEDSIRPGVARSAATGAVADSSAFLWRCQLWGVGPPELPWSEIRDFATRSFPRPSTAFAEAHIVMALAAAGDHAAVESRLAELRRMEREGRQPAGPVVADVAEGMAAYARGDYVEAIRLIQPVFEEIVRVGGSRAQRDVFEQTLLSSYLRAGRVEDAEGLFRRRLEGRPAVPGHLSPSSRRERD